ncbi:MAG: DUF983 domain-containing protein [Caulobacteraceae bacterium]|nr:DUF983 domain-containing protein [Caulobacteraceae bacterium]
MAAMSKRHVVPAIFRGLKGKCPDCGEGRLFWRYLKVQPNCELCGHDLAQYPADDGPAYVTILVLGHLVVAPLLLFPFIWEAPVGLVLPVTLIPIAFMTLGLLPLIKGGFIGLLWALKVRREDAALHTADALD